MEGSIGTGTLPAAAAVLRAQLAVIGRARRWTLALLFVLLLVLLGVAIYIRAEFNPLMALGGSGGPGIFGLVALLALFWALGIWHDEPPSERLYHWSMPVSRGAHDRFRVAAGALVMLAGIAALLIGVALVALSSGYGQELAAVPATRWLNYLTGTLTLYLFGSIASLRSKHPLAWVLGVYIGLNMLPMIIDLVLRLDGRFVEAMGEFAQGRFGYATAMAGGITGVDAADWVPAMLLWLGVAVAAVYVATLRQPDA